MFNESWNFQKLHRAAQQIIHELQEQHIAEALTLPSGASVSCISNLSEVSAVMIICSGYPEQTGAWSYTRLEQSLQTSELLKHASMAPYFKQFHENELGLVALNPHRNGLSEQAEDSLALYGTELLETLSTLETFSSVSKVVLYGFSLGGNALLEALHRHPEWVAKIAKIIFVDPTPPRLGRRKLAPELVELIDQSRFYGLADSEGMPGEFAEATRMRLKIKPQLFPCETHGDLPNLVLPHVLQDMKG